jgi:hypothetical protein
MAPPAVYLSVALVLYSLATQLRCPLLTPPAHILVSLRFDTLGSNSATTKASCPTAPALHNGVLVIPPLLVPARTRMLERLEPLERARLERPAAALASGRHHGQEVASLAPLGTRER